MARMRRYLRRPTETHQLTNWEALYKEALSRATLCGKEDLAYYLRANAGDPEKALRRMSILSVADIKRELG